MFAENTMTQMTIGPSMVPNSNGNPADPNNPMPNPQAQPQFLIKSIDDTRRQNASTILVQSQDHTLGNVVRYQLLKDNRVRFAGYKKPHPLEERIEVRVQTNGDVKPEDAVREACTKLHEELDSLAENFRAELTKWQGDEANVNMATASGVVNL